MESRKFGKTDMHVSVLGFGGAEIGFEKATPDVVAKLLSVALDAGLNVIDTAECYLDSEALIGGAVAGRRDDFYLFTKCGHPESPGKPDWRPESLLQSIQRSLKRLRTDRVDLVHLHSCSEAELRKGDVIGALQRAKEQGLTRYIGYSGDAGAARYAVECGAFDSLQTSLSVFDQQAIDLTLPLAREHGLGVIAKHRWAMRCGVIPNGPRDIIRNTSTAPRNSSTTSCAESRPRGVRRPPVHARRARSGHCDCRNQEPRPLERERHLARRRPAAGR